MSKNLKLKRMVQFLNKNNLKISEMLKHFQTFSIEVPTEKNVCLLNAEFKLFEVIIKKEEYVIAYNNIVNFIKRQVKKLIKEAVEEKKIKKMASSLLKLWNKTKLFIEKDSTSIDLKEFSIWLLKTVIDFSASTRSLPHSFNEFNITDNLNFVDDHFKEASLDVILKLKCVIQPKNRNWDIICTVSKYVLKEHTKPSKNFFKFLKVVLLVKILTISSKAGIKEATSLLEEFMKKMMIPPNFWAWAEQNIALESIPKGKTFKNEKQLKLILQNINIHLVYDVLFDSKNTRLQSSEFRSDNSVTANCSIQELFDCNKSPSRSGKKNKSNNLLRSKDLESSFSEIFPKKKKSVDGNLETVGEWTVKKVNEGNITDAQGKEGLKKKVRKGKKKIVSNKAESPVTSVVSNITDSQVKEGLKKGRRVKKKVSDIMKSPEGFVNILRKKNKKTEDVLVSNDVKNKSNKLKQTVEKNSLSTNSEFSERNDKESSGEKRVKKRKHRMESPLNNENKIKKIRHDPVKNCDNSWVIKSNEKQIVSHNTIKEIKNVDPQGKKIKKRKLKAMLNKIHESSDEAEIELAKIKKPKKKAERTNISMIREDNENQFGSVMPEEIKKDLQKKKIRQSKLKAILKQFPESSNEAEIELAKIKKPKKKAERTNISMIKEDNENQFESVRPEEIKKDLQKKKMRKRNLKAILKQFPESSNEAEIELVKIKKTKKKAERTNSSMIREDNENQFESVMPNSVNKNCSTISDTVILPKSITKTKKVSKEIVSLDTIKDLQKNKIRQRKLKAILKQFQESSNEAEIELVKIKKPKKNVKRSPKPEQIDISMIREDNENEFESVKNCSTLSNTKSLQKSITKTKKVSKERYSDVDEASGNDSDIIECDEDNAMFTKEETCNYHQFQLKETKDNFGKIKAMLSNMPAEEKSLLDEEPSVKNRKLNDNEDDIALNMFYKESRSNDFDSEVRDATTSKDFEHDDDLPYGNDSETDLEIVFATIQKDTDNGNSIVVKKEISDNEDSYQEPIIKTSTAPVKRCRSSASFVASVFNIYGNKDLNSGVESSSGVEVLYDNTKSKKSCQMSVTEAASSHISSLRSSKLIKDRELPALKKNLDKNSDLEFIGSIIMGTREEECHLRNNKDREEECHLYSDEAKTEKCLLDSVEDCRMNNNDNKKDSIDMEEAPDQEILIIDEKCYNDSTIEKKDSSVENDNDIEEECQIDKERINKDEFLKVTDKNEINIMENNETENGKSNALMNSECASDIHLDETRASVCEAAKVDDDILICSISSKDLNFSTTLDPSQENKRVNSQSNCIGKLFTVPENSRLYDDECETSGSVDNCIAEKKKVCSEKLSQISSLEGEPSLAIENLSEENFSDDDFTLRIEESFNDSRKKESLSEFSHIKALSFDEVKDGKKVEIIESYEEISVVTSLESNGLITETVSQSPGNEFIENKENIMDNKQEEDKNSSLISEFSEGNKFSLAVKENENEGNLLLKSLKQETTPRSPSKIGSKRTSIEKSVCNMTTLTPLKVSNAALANEIIISPQVSDEENASQIMNGEIESENILPFISDDILSKSYVEEEQEDEDMEINILSPCSSNGSEIEKPMRRTSRLEKSLNLSDLSCSKLSPLKSSKVSNSLPLSSRKKSARTPSPMTLLSSSKKHSILHSSKKQSPSVSKNQSLTISSEKITSPLSSRAASPISLKDKSPIPSKISSPLLSRTLTSPFSCKKSPLSTSSLSYVKKSPVFTKPSPITNYQVAVKAKNSPNGATSSPLSLVRRSPRHVENIISVDSSTNESKPDDMPLKESEASRSCSPTDQSEERDIILSPLKTRYSLRRLRNPVTPEKQMIDSPRRRSSLSSVKKENIETQSLSSPVRPRARRNSLSNCATPVRRSRRISGLPEDIAE